MITTKHFLLFAGLLVGFVLPVTVSASSAVSSKEVRQGVVQKIMDQQDGQSDQLFSGLENTSKLKKAKLLVKKRFGGDKVDFKTEPDRWMWYWLAGWAIGLALTIVGIPLLGTVGLLFTSLAGLFWAAGSVCGIIWLLKISGAID